MVVAAAIVRADEDIMAGGVVAGGVGVMRELGVTCGAELPGGVAKVPHDSGCTTPVSREICPSLCHFERYRAL